MFKISDVWHLELEGPCKVYSKSPPDYQWEKLNYREVRQLVQYHNLCSSVGLRWVIEPFNPKLSCVLILLWQPPLLVCLIFISEKALATHSSTLAWKIPWMEESGGLQSMRSLGVGTLLSDFTFPFPFHALEKEMATHSSVLAWRIPGTGEPGGLPSIGLHRVGHDWSDLAAAATAFLFKHFKSA